MDPESDWAMVQSGIPGESRPSAAPLVTGSIQPASQGCSWWWLCHRCMQSNQVAGLLPLLSLLSFTTPRTT